MNRVEEILIEVFKPYGGLGKALGTLGGSTINMLFKKANEQTALEFTKWKDENYAFHDKYNGYFNTKDHIKKGVKEFKTSEQLFNEWNNGLKI